MLIFKATVGSPVGHTEQSHPSVGAVQSHPLPRLLVIKDQEAQSAPVAPGTHQWWVPPTTLGIAVLQPASGGDRGDLTVLGSG